MVDIKFKGERVLRHHLRCADRDDSRRSLREGERHGGADAGARAGALDERDVRAADDVPRQAPRGASGGADGGGGRTERGGGASGSAVHSHDWRADGAGSGEPAGVVRCDADGPRDRDVLGDGLRETASDDDRLLEEGDRKRDSGSDAGAGAGALYDRDVRAGDDVPR